VTRSDLPIEWVAATENPAIVTMSGETTLLPTFVAPGVIGEYVFKLSVRNGEFVGQSRVTVNVTELVVNAGSDQRVLSGDTVRLTGTYDTAGVAAPSLSVEWVAAPDNPAPVTLSGATTLSPTFVVPDVVGEYVFELSVRNGEFVGQSRVTVTVTELVVNAGAAQRVLSGDTVRLVGTYDTAGIVVPSLSINWVAAAGNPATVTLSGATTLSPTFVAPGTPGTYSFDLKVQNNGIIRTAKTNVQVRTLTWTQATASAPWSGRGDHATAVFDNKMWVIGGLYKNDVWSSSDGVTWTQVTASAPWSGRRGHTTAVFDNKLWVIGGNDRNFYKNDVWSSSDGLNWTQATASVTWSGRGWHTTAVFDNKLWVIGGYDGSHKNDVWSSSDGVTWTQATASVTWSGRGWHTTAVFDNKLWVIGGNDRNFYKNDVWSSLDGLNWTQTTAYAPWSDRSYHTTAVFDNKLWVIGGYNGSRKNDVWSSSDGVTWTQATVSSPWSGRDEHTTAVFDDKLWVIGGRDRSFKNDVWFMELTE
jgi:hypothetical protein